jgi:uncharacterized membrane protein
VGTQTGHLTGWKPASPAAAWYFFVFSTKIFAQRAEIFVEKNEIFRPAGGEIRFRVSDRVTRVINRQEGMERSLYPRMAVTLFALLGMLDAVYLTLTRFFPSVGLTCPLAGSGCETVQMSPWSTFPPGGGAPIAVLGIIGYLVLFGLGLAALQTERLGRVALPVALLVVASGGIATAIYLVSIQLFVITAVCFWCVISALLMVGIWIAAFIDWRLWRGGLTGHGRLAGAGVAPRAR